MIDPARIAPLGIEYTPATWPGAKESAMRVAADRFPARVVKLHNDHKAHFIRQYLHTVAAAMSKKWAHRAFIDMFAGPGVCWVEETGKFVAGSPLIALEARPQFDHYVMVDMDSECTAALEHRFAVRDTEAAIICNDANATDTIDAVRAAIPRRQCLSLALLDPQGCNLHLETIRRLTDDRPMDLLINLPIHSLYRCLTASQWHVLDDVLGPEWRGIAGVGVRGWRAAVRNLYREQLAAMGYPHSSAKEVRSENKNSPLYDFILASRHPIAKDFFEKVTRETAHGQLSIC